MRITNPILFVSLLFLFIIGCAVPGDISGGPKDDIPPKIIAYLPDSNILNFKGKLLAFDYNEKIQLKNLAGQFQITPAMDEQPQIIANGNRLSINFKNPLADNTTYILNFGNAITDLNEGNAINDFKYIFSTGNYIDSLKINGLIKDAYTNTALKDIKVLLFKDTGTTDLIRRKPTYYVKSNSNGQFQFDNLKKDQYRLIVIEDKNNNNSYDNKDERIGFIKQSLKLESNIELPEIKIFKEEDELSLKRKNNTQYGKIELFYTQCIDSLKLEPHQKNNKINLIGPFYSALRDSITYFYSEKNQDTLSYTIIAMRTGKVIPKDTLYLPPVTLNDKKAEASGRGKGVSNDPLKPILKINAQYHHTDTLKLIANIPIKDLSIVPEVKVGKYSIKGNWKINPNDPRLLSSDIVLAADKEYKITVLKNACQSIYETMNDSSAYTIKTQPATYFGTIKINLRVDSILKGQAYIVKLLDEKSNTVKTLASNASHSYTFNYMNPIDYTLKIEVGQYKWQTGNYKSQQQASAIYYYKEIIKLRSDWTSEIEWIIAQ